jgi:hypothetical protein
MFRRRKLACSCCHRDESRVSCSGARLKTCAVTHRVAICMLFMWLGTEGSAQQRVGSVYATAGVSFPRQAAPDPDLTRPPFSAPGGSTVGWLVGGGVFVSPGLSLEGEFSSTGLMKSQQSGRGFMESSERRDRFVSVGLKAHLPLLGSVIAVEPIGGLVLVHGRVSYEDFRVQARPSGTGVITELVPSGRGHVDLDWNPGLMFGGDVRIGGQRFAVVAGLRFAFTDVPEGSNCVIGFAGDEICSDREEVYFPGYYPRWTQRPSVSLAVNF